MRNKQDKTLIIGAGLAGISIAISLLRRNMPFHLVGKKENFSSTVAAGQINPIVFRRMAKSWRVDEFLPNAISFYQELESQFNTQFYFEKPIRRAFAHEQERDFWEKKQYESEYETYIQILEDADYNYPHCKQTIGTGKVLNSSYVDTKHFIETTQQFLLREGKMSFGTIDYTSISSDKIEWMDEKFAQAIFCEGYHVKENPFFSYLPLNPTKGELLTIHSTEIPSDEALNRKCFLLPIGNDLFKLGATYVWDQINTEKTQEAKEFLLEQVHNLTDASIEVRDQEAGIRPTVVDRRPLMGSHPEEPNLFIFNGLGTKGYLMAPLLAKEMLDFMFEDQTLDKELNISRFDKRYRNQ